MSTQLPLHAGILSGSSLCGARVCCHTFWEFICCLIVVNPISESYNLPIMIPEPCVWRDADTPKRPITLSSLHVDSCGPLC